jgi:hypothetical protein
LPIMQPARVIRLPWCTQWTMIGSFWSYTG